MDFASALAERMEWQGKAERWRVDPVAWVEDRLGEHVWSKQAEVMRSVATNPLVTVQSAHSTGKSHLASRLVAWFLSVNPPEDTFVVTTAPTAAQVRAILWRYITQVHAKGGLAGRVTQAAEWKIDDQLVAYGRKPSDYSESNFSGIHAKHLLVILDEACGVSRHLWVAADSLATGVDSHILAIGNPDDNGSHFYKVCTTEPGWTRHKISAYDSPAITGEPVPQLLLDTLVSKAWIDDKKQRWGEGSPLYKAKVLGEFADSDDSMIPLSWVSAANRRWQEWDEAGRPPQPGRLVLGVDVARFGDDKTCLAWRWGDVVEKLERHAKLDTTQTTSLVQAALHNQVQPVAVVDVIGIGAGVVDQLRSLRLPVRAFNASQATRMRDITGSWKFPNCLTGEDRVTPIGELRRIYRAPYQGPLFEVEMASGDHFTATANHQVLTGRGWVPVQSLNVGDQLCDASRAEAVPAGNAGPEVHNVPPSLSEVYGAAARLFGSERVLAGAVNFHGDRPAGDVDVVTVDRDLLSVDPSSRQEAQDLDLVRLLVAEGLLAVERPLVRALWVRGSEVRVGAPLPCHSVPGGVLDSLRHGHPVAGQRVGFGGRPAHDALAFERSDDGAVVDAVRTAQSLHRFPSEVALHYLGLVDVDRAGQRDRLLASADPFASFQQSAVDDAAVNAERLGKHVHGLAISVSGNDLSGWDLQREGEANGFLLPAHGDALRLKDRLHALPVRVEPPAKREQGFSGPIPGNEVVSIKVRSDSTHGGGSFVYTLETSSGTYSTTSGLHKNCR